MGTMPTQKPGRSIQSVATPPDFLGALLFRLGLEDFDWDLAASEDNRVTAHFYSEDDNALTMPWNLGSGWNWCNPPFSSLSEWVEKASNESILGAKTALLVPASVGSNWWRDYVHQKCYVLLLNGRITFVGHDSPYPKDLAVLLYDRSRVDGGYGVWDWRKDIKNEEEHS